MNLMLFSLIFILFTFNVPLQLGEESLIFDILPDFVGYLILWLALEKRRINRNMGGVYTVVSVMTLISFGFFAAQLRFLFPDFLNGDGLILGWILAGVSYINTNFNDLILLTAVLLLGWMFLSLREYWQQKDRHKIQCAACNIGMTLCGIIALCHIGASAVILPFSWHWISYPLSAIAIVIAWFAMKDSPEMLTGIRESYNKDPMFSFKNK